MTAQILQFIRRPNPKREAEQSIEAMFTTIWGPFFAWQELMGTTKPVEHTAPDDDCA